MDSEKDLLKQDLAKQEKPEEIKKFIEDVELMGENEDIVALAKKKLEEILAKADNIEKTNESQTSQVESMGGTGEEIVERTKGVDQKIEEFKVETTEKIEEVRNIPTTDNIESEILSETPVGKEVKEVKEVKEEMNEVKEKISKMKSLDEASSLSEAEKYSEKLEQEYIELGQKDIPKVEEILSTITDEELIKIYEPYKDLNSAMKPEERISEMKKTLENTKSKNGDEISSNMILLVHGIIKLRGQNEDFFKQLKEDENSQIEKGNEAARLSRFKKILPEIQKLGNIKFAEKVIAERDRPNPDNLHALNAFHSDTINLAKNFGLVSQDEIKQAYANYIDEHLVPEKNDRQFINNKMVGMLSGVFEKTLGLSEEFVKDELRKRGLDKLAEGTNLDYFKT